MKKLIVFVSLFALALVVAPKAEAATIRNINTGWRSVNRTIVREPKVYVHGEFKVGGVSNTDVVLENTGGNRTNANTTGTNSVESGDVAADVTTGPDYVNYTDVLLDQSDSADSDLVENNTTGARSTNVASVQRTHGVLYLGVSIGGVSNTSVVALNSGGNSASRNTVGGNTVTSGDAEATVGHTSDVNSTVLHITQ